MTAVPEMITAYRDGRFCMVEAPEWWSAFETRPDKYEGRFGQEFGNNIETSEIPEEIGTGWLIRFQTFARSFGVWVPTNADFLELLTTRAGPFIKLGEDRLIGESLEHIRNAIIAFARHGEGQHIEASTGLSRIDMQRAREERLRYWAAAGQSIEDRPDTP